MVNGFNSAFACSPPPQKIEIIEGVRNIQVFVDNGNGVEEVTENIKILTNSGLVALNEYYKDESFSTKSDYYDLRHEGGSLIDSYKVIITLTDNRV